MKRHLSVFSLIAVIAAFSNNALATITINSNSVQLSNASNVITVSNAAPTFYYSNITETKDGSNNYTGDPTGATCNSNLNPNCRKITDTFSLTFTSTAAQTGGTPKMYWIYSAIAPTGTVPGAFTVISTVNYTVGQATTFGGVSGITFGAICTALGGVVANLGTACQNTNIAAPGPLTATFYLVADTTGAGTIGSEVLAFTMKFLSSIPAEAVNGSLGLYGFLTFPGDEKIHLKAPAGQAGIVTDLNFPTNDNGGIQFARFYYAVDPNGGTDYIAANAATVFNEINLTVPNPYVNHVDTGVNDDATLQSYFIPKLSNGVRYYVKAALLDKAGNVGYLTAAADSDRTHSAVPDQVIGLLAESGHCFIATAAFGSPLASEVKILRKFRDQILMKSKFGRNFVSWYYKKSPYWAAKIENHDTIKTVIRGFLYPLIGFSFLALQMGAYNASLFFVTLLLFPLLILRFKKNSNRTLAK